MKIKKYHAQHSVITDEEVVLAGFWRRTAAMLIDLILISFLIGKTSRIFTYFGIETGNVSFDNFHVKVTGVDENHSKIIELVFTAIPVLYFALLNYFTNGKTIGKWIMRIRVVSIYHHRISLWHCIERSLGYAASAVEAGLGFLQIFWNPNRMCLHDRIAETIVVKEKKKEAGKQITTTV